MSAHGPVLVTGAGGFLGRWAVAGLLARGVETIAAVSPNGSAAPELHGARLATCDLLDAARVAALIQETRPKTLIHFAWNATPGLYWTTADNFDWLAATTQLAKTHYEAGGARFVFASTCAEYDWGRADICRETQTPTVLGALASAKPYALCKALAREALEGLARRYERSCASGRIFFQYGPHEHPNRLASSVIRALLAGERVETTHGRQVRDFLHARDVGDAFAALALCDAEGPINIGSGEAVTLAAFVDAIANQIGRPDLVALGARAAPPDEPAVLRPDITRLRDAAGWSPHFTLDTGLADAIAWWRARQGRA